MLEDNNAPVSQSNETPEFVPPLTETEFYATLEDFDAIKDLPVWKGADTINEGRGEAPPLTLAAFGPDHQDQIKARAAELTSYSPDAAIAQAISEKLNREAINLRVRSTSDDASHYVREHCALEYEMVEAEKETRVIFSQLEAKRTVVDPATGKLIETDDYKIDGEKRTALLLKASELWERSKALAEREGPKRLEEAKRKDWAEYTEVHKRTWELSEIDRRAHRMVQDDRLNSQAAARARHLKGGN